MDKNSKQAHSHSAIYADSDRLWERVKALEKRVAELERINDLEETHRLEQSEHDD